MADLISKSHVLTATCGGHLPGGPPPSKTGVFSVGFPPLSSSPPSSSSPFSAGFEALRSSSSSGFHGRNMVVGDDRGRPLMVGMQTVPSQVASPIGKAMKWWEKGLQPNMREVESAQGLVDSLVNAGNQLVVVDFFSPGCGGCRALHPKICQIAEMNPELLFLHVNYEEHKSICYSLNIHVLPFFRFYRGAQGRVCSFSCTNATIKKFKDAMAKHSTERCSLGPAKGLEESELQALAHNKDLSFSYSQPPGSATSVPHEVEAEHTIPIPVSPELPVTAKATSTSEEKDLVTA